MDEGFRFADDLGPETVVHIHRPAVGLRAIVVIDNVAAGPSIGGVRMAPDVSLEECVGLARAMTLKNAAAGLPHGGGKSVIFADPRMPADAKERLIRAFASSIAGLADYIPGPDMGTNETMMAFVLDEIGRAVGLPRVLGGIPLDEIGATGYGLAAAAEVAARVCHIELDGARIAIQGFGAVGMHAARYLAAKGGVLVAASDSRGTVHDAGGLDLARLMATKAAGCSLIDGGVGIVGGVDEIIGVDCDIWIPAARPHVLHAGNAASLRTRMVLQGANIPATKEAEQHLHDRGVIVLPDFIVNAGGVICAAVEYRHGTETTALEVIAQKISANTETVLARAAAQSILPRAAAEALALERVHAAMRCRRWGERDR